MEKDNQIGIGSMVALKSQPEVQMEVVRMLRITNLVYCKHVHCQNGEVTYTYVNMDQIEIIKKNGSNKPQRLS